MPRYHFTKDWFTNNIPLWQSELSRYKTQPTLFLEVGSYEGRSALWALDNILTHPRSKAYCVDSFEAGTFPTFQRNTAAYRKAKKLVTLRGKSQDMLKHPTLLSLKDSFDIIYLDANHHTSHVLEDAILSFPLLKPGGLLIFDDYTNSKNHDQTCPKPGIDAFLDAYAPYLRVLHTRWQVIAQKRVTPLPSATRPCKSEFYDY